MKVVFSLALFLSASVFAATNETPFQLPEGNYEMTCTNSSYSKVDGQERRSYSADEGQMTVRYVGNKTIMQSWMKPMNVEDKFQMYDVTTYVRESLGDSKYRDTATSTATYTEADGKVENFSTSWIRTFKVEGPHEINLTVKRDNEPETQAVGETVWIKVSDKVFIENGYQRGPFKRVREDGKVVETISSMSSCTHKLK